MRRLQGFQIARLDAADAGLTCRAVAVDGPEALLVTDAVGVAPLRLRPVERPPGSAGLYSAAGSAPWADTRKGTRPPGPAFP